MTQQEFRFNGPAYSAEFDQERLSGQMRRVFNLMKDGIWRTLSEISLITGDPPASVSAQLRHLRKPRFGGFIVGRQPRGDRKSGLWEYRLDVLVHPARRNADSSAAGCS